MSRQGIWSSLLKNHIDRFYPEKKDDGKGQQQAESANQGPPESGAAFANENGQGDRISLSQDMGSLQRNPGGVKILLKPQS